MHKYSFLNQTFQSMYSYYMYLYIYRDLKGKSKIFYFNENMRYSSFQYLRNGTFKEMYNIHL